MPASPNLALPYIQASQAQKHVTHNEAIRFLDGLVQLSALTRALTSPPGSPADGDRHIVASGATGAWAGWDDSVAFWIDGAWFRLIPREGWLCFVSADTDHFKFVGGAWVALGLGGGGGGATIFNDLLDVSLASLIAGQGVSYNGTDWVNGWIDDSPGLAITLGAGAIANWTPLGLADGTRLVEVSMTAGAVTLRGLTNGRSGRQLIIRAAEACTSEAVITHEDGAATAANRFNLPEGASITLARNESLILHYSGLTSRWHVSGRIYGLFSATAPGIVPPNTAGGRKFMRGDVSWTDLDLDADAPSAPGTDIARVFGSKVAGRMMLGVRGPNLKALVAQARLGGESRQTFWNPPGNATTLPGVFGMAAPTITGSTAVSKSVQTTNRSTRQRRIQYDSAASAGAVAEWRVAVSQFTIGDGSGIGGFHLDFVFGHGDAAPVSGARMAFGMAQGGTAATNANPSTRTNYIALGHDDADTNMHIFYGGSAAQTPIDLGANFPVAANELYHFQLFAPPDTADTVHYEVMRLNTGHVATGTLTGTSGVALPSPTQLLSPAGYRTNNATALAVSYFVSSLAVENWL